MVKAGTAGKSGQPSVSGRSGETLIRCACRYVPALYDPSTSTLHIHPTAPLYLLTHTAKRLRVTVADEQRTAAQLRGAEYKAKRNDLGDTFGTKKAKSQIKAEERNKVDVSAMQGVKSHLMDSIGVRDAADAPEGERASVPLRARTIAPRP